MIYLQRLKHTGDKSQCRVCKALLSQNFQLFWDHCHLLEGPGSPQEPSTLPRAGLRRSDCERCKVIWEGRKSVGNEEVWTLLPTMTGLWEEGCSPVSY